MSKDNRRSTAGVDRRSFLGGIGGLLAAASISRPVSGDRATPVRSDADSNVQTVTSPDGSVSVTVDVTDGVPSYSVEHEGVTVLEQSELGFAFQNQPTFGEGVTVTGSERSVVDTTWEPVWDRYDEIREHYRELRIGLAEPSAPGRGGTLELRVFDDGLGFRFVFGESFGDPFVITSERTAYNFAGDYDAWWIPNDYNSFEYEYEETALSEVQPELSETSFDGVHTPMTMATDDGRYLSVHEADLTDYASLAIAPADGPTSFESALAPLPDGTKVSASAPHLTPWRTIQIGTDPGDLVESSLVANLNEDYDESVFEAGVDWIEPQKFVGIWWLMITGRADWEYTGMESGNHGAQTGRAKQYMAFASEHGIPGVLVEGWNEGWSSYPGDGSAFDFTDPYPDFDLQAVTDFGPTLDPPTQMTMHNETAGDFRNYEQQAPEAFDRYDELGIHTIKNGYVSDSGNLAGEGYNHHNQVLVNHHTVIAETAAANRQMLDIHEPIHPSGRRRRYPNLMTREGVKGQEYDSFGAVSPEHHVTFPFTRMLAGPVEYTPGIFDMDSGSGGIETTRAKQLAMYPTYFSGLQMVADLPSSYLADQPASFSLGNLQQAEFGDLDGFGTAHRWANAQAEGYVPVDPNSVTEGASATFTVEDVPADGKYDLHLRYASDSETNAVPADTDRTVTVFADGTETQVTVPPTAYWDQWTTISVPVALSEGDNEVGFALTDADTGGLNVDAVAVTETDEPMPEPSTSPITGPTVDAFQFVEDVPAAGWDDTRVIDAEIGDYMVTARQHGEEWYLGAMTDEGGRALDVPLEFLSPAAEHSQGNGNQQGPRYVAELYSDGVDVRFDANLTDVRVDEAIVTPGTTLLTSMARSGGTAVRLRPATGEDLRELPRYERPEQDVSVTISEDAFVREPFITATGSNDGEYVGGTTLELYVDGSFQRTANVRFAPDTDDGTFTSTFEIGTAGEYDVTVRTPEGTVLASETVTIKPPEPVATLTDPTGDDYGPGGYTYPTADAFPPGVFDLERVTVARTPSIAQFTFEVETLNDAFGSSRGFSPHMFVCWIRDPNASGGTTSSLDDLNATVDFESPWHYRLEISGFTKSLVDASGSPVRDEDGNVLTVRDSVDTAADTVSVAVDRNAFGTPLEELEIVAMVQSENFGALRPVQETAGGYVFGGATPGAVDNAPLIMDLITPEGVSQGEALAYDAESRATLPFVPL